MCKHTKSSGSDVVFRSYFLLFILLTCFISSALGQTETCVVFQYNEFISNNQNIPFSFFMLSCFHRGRLAKASLLIPNMWLKSESERCFWKQTSFAWDCDAHTTIFHWYCKAAEHHGQVIANYLNPSWLVTTESNCEGLLMGS